MLTIVLFACSCGFALSFSPSGGRAVKFFFANFSAFIFCTKFGGLHGFSPPLAGVGGWKKDNCSKFHPLTPASGGNTPCKPKTSGLNFNILPLVKQNLTALPLEGVRGRISILYSFLRIQFLLMRQPLISAGLLTSIENLKIKNVKQ